MYETSDSARAVDAQLESGNSTHIEVHEADECLIRGRKTVRLSGRLMTYEGVNQEVTVKDLGPGGALLAGIDGEGQSVPIEFKLWVMGKDGVEMLKAICRLVHLQWDVDGSLSLGCRFVEVDYEQLEVCLRTD